VFNQPYAYTSSLQVALVKTSLQLNKTNTHNTCHTATVGASKQHLQLLFITNAILYYILQTHVGIKDSIPIGVIKPEHNCNRQQHKLQIKTSSTSQIRVFPKNTNEKSTTRQQNSYMVLVFKMTSKDCTCHKSQIHVCLIKGN